MKIFENSLNNFTGRVQQRQWLRFQRQHLLEVEQLRNKLEQGMVQRNK